MSRLAKKTIFTEEAACSLEKNILFFSGPMGQSKLVLPKGVICDLSHKHIKVSLLQDVQNIALAGTYYSHIKNAIYGVMKGFSKKLILDAVGYNVSVNGNKLALNLGYSHPVNYELPSDISASYKHPNLFISGVNKTLVGQVASDLSNLKELNCKGKGIRIEGQLVRIKEKKK